LFCSWQKAKIGVSASAKKSGKEGHEKGALANLTAEHLTLLWTIANVLDLFNS